MDSVETIRDQALALSASERARLAHDLILSLGDPSRFDLGPAYEAEIQRRLKAVREGTATTRPADEVFADIRAKLS